MYMYYFVYNTGDGGHTYHYNNIPSKWLKEPSECCWIVPGTVSPLDD